MCNRFAGIPREVLDLAVGRVKAEGAPDGCVALARELAAMAAGDVRVGEGLRASAPNSPEPQVGDATRREGREALATDACPAPTDLLSFQLRPGASCPVLLVRDGKLVVEEMTFGYEAPWHEGKLVYNARLERALAERDGMWSESLGLRRCVAPALCFYEPDHTRTAVSKRTGRGVRQQVRFSSADGLPFYLAGIYQGRRFAVMTCPPDATVRPVHDRMPVTLRPQDARLWLGRGYGRALDLPRVRLVACDE